MSLNIRVLFEEPQHEIASLLRDRMSRCRALWMVTGFATVEGIEAIAPALLSQPSKLPAFIVGAGTYRGFEALDRLLSKGVQPDRLYVHLGHSRPSGGRRHPFYRYHPMLHSKVYLLEMEDGHAIAIIGSHNITGYALLGLNGEAAVVVEGLLTDPEMQKIKHHIDLSRNQSVQYLPSMKEAFTWWTSEFIDGLQSKVNDHPREDFESRKTIVVLGVGSAGQVPKKDDVIYFEIPAALRGINTLDLEVHIFIFDSRPASPWDALNSLAQARASLECIVLGLEREQGGRELQADWHIPSRHNPMLLQAPQPFRPSVSPDMLQVRVKVGNAVRRRYEYLFELDKGKWAPIFDNQAVVHASTEETQLLASLQLNHPEDMEWFLVKGLQRADEMPNAYHVALRESAPESGSFILVSLRRREISKTK